MCLSIVQAITYKITTNIYLFIALNISMTTRMERLIVVAFCENVFVNISQPISGNSSEHWWKWD